MPSTQPELIAAAKTYRAAIQSHEDVIGSTRPFFDQLAVEALRVRDIVDAEASGVMRVDKVERIGDSDVLRMSICDADLTVSFTTDGIEVSATASGKPINIQIGDMPLGFDRVSRLTQVPAPPKASGPQIAFAFDRSHSDGGHTLSLDELVAALIQGATDRRERRTLALRKRLKLVYVP